MKRVYCLKDDSGHWYVIPFELKEEFYKKINYLLENEDNIDDNYYKVSEEFELEFGKYATGGDLNNIQLFAKI